MVQLENIITVKGLGQPMTCVHTYVSRTNYFLRHSFNLKLHGCITIDVFAEHLKGFGQQRAVKTRFQNMQST